mmetsp:Transcript_3948/g.7618  ORF Transcript_3948/g.7618 Transcript_3948/m.7618 type:complete len:93 (+) Transcript_3948:895-1173(+)
MSKFLHQDSASITPRRFCRGKKLKKLRCLTQTESVKNKLLSISISRDEFDLHLCILNPSTPRLSPLAVGYFEIHVDAEMPSLEWAPFPYELV